jgi:hypothetical protein
MNIKRVSLGFDLRINPALQENSPSQLNQRLLPHIPSPISADPSVWLQPEEIASLWQGKLHVFSNPLNLAKSTDLLIDACQKKGLSITGLWPVCVTSYEPDRIALIERYGPGYFDDQLDEAGLLSSGWRFLGFDVADLNGLISGLKGCGYREPTWSLLRNHFGTSLNESGLFTDLMVASSFAEIRGLQIGSHAPFVTVGIFTRDPLS